MLRDYGRLNTMPSPRTTFPVSEGLGVFVGVVAWDVLVDGHMEIIKAALIAAACSVVWYGVRYWKEKFHRNHH